MISTQGRNKPTPVLISGMLLHAAIVTFES